jgi:methionyl-tRNA formyltransferase
MRLVYMGTPQFAVPPLKAIKAAGHEVVAVFSQPDRPKGRGQKLEAPPVKQAAMELGLEVYQPLRIRQPEVVEQLKNWQVPVMVVVGYGQILPAAIIDLAPLGIVNIHASLLPKYRGAAPIQWAVANGETVTGVSTMKIDVGLDTGDVLEQDSTAIGKDESAEELSVRLSEMGSRLIVSTLEKLAENSIKPQPQDGQQATVARILTKEDGRIDWRLAAAEVHNRVRGFQPWPGGYTTFRGGLLRVARTSLVNETGFVAGQVEVRKKQLLVGCGDGRAVELQQVQMEGRPRISAEAFLNGQRLQNGERLGEQNS